MWQLLLRAAPPRPAFVSTSPVIMFLQEWPELVHASPLVFRAAPDHPWISLRLRHSGAAPAQRDQYTAIIDRIEIECADQHARGYYEQLAGRLAAYLGWTAWTEPGQRIVWPPTNEVV
jgi:hypothetical protein